MVFIGGRGKAGMSFEDLGEVIGIVKAQSFGDFGERHSRFDELDRLFDFPVGIIADDGIPLVFFKQIVQIGFAVKDALFQVIEGDTGEEIFFEGCHDIRYDMLFQFLAVGDKFYFLSGSGAAADEADEQLLEGVAHYLLRAECGGRQQGDFLSEGESEYLFGFRKDLSDQRFFLFAEHGAPLDDVQKGGRALKTYDKDDGFLPAVRTIGVRTGGRDEKELPLRQKRLRPARVTGEKSLFHVHHLVKIVRFLRVTVSLLQVQVFDRFEILDRERFFQLVVVISLHLSSPAHLLYTEKYKNATKTI